MDSDTYGCLAIYLLVPIEMVYFSFTGREEIRRDKYVQIVLLIDIEPQNLYGTQLTSRFRTEYDYFMFYWFISAKSPVFSMINSTIAGLSTIRSSNSQKRLLTIFDQAQVIFFSCIYHVCHVILIPIYYTYCHFNVLGP